MTEEKNIILNIGVEKISAKLFREKVNSFLDLLNEVGKFVGEGKKKISWQISVEKGSQIIKAFPKSKAESYIDTALNLIDEGITSLSKGTSTLMPEKMLEDIMIISKPYKNNGESIDKILLSVNNKPQTLDNSIVKNIQDIIGISSQAYGTVEGKLEVVSKRHGLSFVIADRLTDKAVKCVFKDEKLLERVFESWDKRVSVYGLIRYNKRGEIISILVDNFRVLLDKNKLPTSRDVLGIFLNN